MDFTLCGSTRKPGYVANEWYFMQPQLELLVYTTVKKQLQIVVVVKWPLRLSLQIQQLQNHLPRPLLLSIPL